LCSCGSGLESPAALKKVFRSFSRSLQARRDTILVTAGPLFSKSLPLHQPPFGIMSTL
jgi:hypothetical protein